MGNRQSQFYSSNTRLIRTLKYRHNLPFALWMIKFTPQDNISKLFYNSPIINIFNNILKLRGKNDMFYK